MKLFVLLFFVVYVCAKRENDSEEAEDAEDEEESVDTAEDLEYYKYLNSKLKEQAEEAKKRPHVPPQPYILPGPYDPLPGRSHNADYWPVFPFVNQFHGAVEFDPSVSRRLIADLNIPVNSWGMLDIFGHFFNRTSGTATKYGMISHPINMMGLNKEDFVRLMSDPALQHNRNIQPLLPIGKLPKSDTPLSCKPPLCNPYTQTFAMGVEHDIGGVVDGFDANLDVPIPIGKELAYRFPVGGNFYWDHDNISLSYGQSLASVDPFVNPLMMGNQGFLDLKDSSDRFLKATQERPRRSLTEAHLPYRSPIERYSAPALHQVPSSAPILYKMNARIRQLGPPAHWIVVKRRRPYDRVYTVVPRRPIRCGCVAHHQNLPYYLNFQNAVGIRQDRPFYGM